MPEPTNHPRRMCARVLALLRVLGPLTDTEILDHYNELADSWPEATPAEIREVRSRLEAGGGIVASGEAVYYPAGSQTAWQIAS